MYTAALCEEKTVSAVLKQIPSLPVTKTEAAWTDKKCNWSVVEHWASWWSKPEHLKMCAPFADMSAETWELCPATTIAVERKNAECKENQPLPLKVALASLYKLDKAVCFKHIASLKDTSITYRSKTAESRANEAICRKEERNKRSHHDPDAQYRPPDKKSSFESKSALKDLTNTGKGKSTLKGRKRNKVGDDAISQPPPSKRQCLHIGGHKCNTPDMGILGRNIEMEFEDDSGNATTWWTGIVTQYDPPKDQYAAFFPSDNATVWFQAEDEDYRVIP